jgi:hypothetical protein
MLSEKNPAVELAGEKSGIEKLERWERIQEGSWVFI